MVGAASCPVLTPETNITAEKCWLQDDFPFQKGATSRRAVPVTADPWKVVG